MLNSFFICYFMFVFTVFANMVFFLVQVLDLFIFCLLGLGCTFKGESKKTQYIHNVIRWTWPLVL